MQTKMHGPSETAPLVVVTSGLRSSIDTAVAAAVHWSDAPTQLSYCQGKPCLNAMQDHTQCEAGGAFNELISLRYMK